jgi:hypothetical protein
MFTCMLSIALHQSTLNAMHQTSKNASSGMSAQEKYDSTGHEEFLTHIKKLSLLVKAAKISDDPDDVDTNIEIDTKLCQVSAHGFLDCVKILLSLKKFEPEALNNALIAAQYLGHDDCARELIAAGAHQKHPRETKT